MTVTANIPTPERTVQKVNFLESLLRCGEEPYEIHYYVFEAAENCAANFVVELHSAGLVVAPDLVKVMISHLFGLLYLDRWSRSASLKRTFKPALRQYFSEMPHDCMSDALAGLTPFEVISLFFRALSRWGYDLNSTRLERAVREVQHEMRNDRTPQAEAVGRQNQSISSATGNTLLDRKGCFFIQSRAVPAEQPAEQIVPPAIPLEKPHNPVQFPEVIDDDTDELGPTLQHEEDQYEKLPSNESLIPRKEQMH